MGSFDDTQHFGTFKNKDRCCSSFWLLDDESTVGRSELMRADSTLSVQYIFFSERKKLPLMTNTTIRHHQTNYSRSHFGMISLLCIASGQTLEVWQDEPSTMASVIAMPNRGPDLGLSAAFTEQVFDLYDRRVQTHEFAILPRAFHGFVLLVSALLSMYSLGHNSRVGLRHQPPSFRAGPALLDDLQRDVWVPCYEHGTGQPVDLNPRRDPKRGGDSIMIGFGNTTVGE